MDPGHVGADVTSVVSLSPEHVMPASAIFTPPVQFERRLLLGIAIIALIVSGIAPKDRLTWLLEVVWVIVAIPIIILNWRRFPLTRLLCWLMVAHALVLIYGGTYTYAETPLGFWLRDVFDFQRNPWDRVGHLMQGFVPAILARELLLRCTPLRRGGWLVYLVLAACLSFSALFELIEWWAALIYGADADAFLATQGDVWDTQWDMFLCLAGAVLSLLLWSRLHDRQLGPAALVDH
jgi:putative membrane protein